jgi:putative nucleotidyltransferase with HDIG domain
MNDWKAESSLTGAKKGIIKTVMPTNKSTKTKIRSFKKSKSVRRLERDTLHRGKKNNVKARNSIGPEIKTWCILLGLSVIISLLLFPNILTRPKIYKLGDVADRDIKASREFLVENNELSDKSRQDAVRAVLSVYDFGPSAKNVISRIKEAFKAGRGYVDELLSVTRAPENHALQTEKAREGHPTSIVSFKEQFFEILDTSPNDKVFDTLLKSGFPSKAEEAAINLVTQVLNNGVVSNRMMLMSQSGKGIILQDIDTQKEIKVTDLDRFYDLKSAKESVRVQGRVLYESMGSRELPDAVMELAGSLIQPNLTFNKRETGLREDLARKSVKPFYFKVKEGEMLVREGERITPEHLLKLSEQYKFLKHEEILGRAPAMAILIGFLLFSMYLVGLMNEQSSKASFKDLLFSGLTLLAVTLVVIASHFMAYEIARGFHFFTPRALLFAIPVASGAMLISIFQGMSVAASFSLIASVLAAFIVGGRVEFFVYFFISSLVAAYGVRSCRERSVFIKTGLKVSLSNMILALSIQALYTSLYNLDSLISIVSALVGGILVAVIATGILPLIEMSFGYTTDIKLLELANLDQPLLRELMVQAPGTYHHSVIVSNMVEASAESINANPVLAKVAAYYHDIGKTKKPLYFIENQTDSENRHEKLAPSMSSLILISHLKDGVELVKKHKLGKEIIDITRQHHGTSVISFFYEKAKEQAEKKGGKFFQVKEEDFRYPGPKPQTKEAGLVMLADVVEAASKTLVDPTPARIQGMVQKIISKVFSDGQLDECELTLKDLDEIAKSFNKTLSGIFHHRVEYPESVALNGVIRKGENGNSDHLSATNSWAKNQEDKTEAKKGLRRLGMS